MSCLYAKGERSNKLITFTLYKLVGMLQTVVSVVSPLGQMYLN